MSGVEGYGVHRFECAEVALRGTAAAVVLDRGSVLVAGGLESVLPNSWVGWYNRPFSRVYNSNGCKKEQI
eukprot:9466367-Pyramimonas_sp.AAC.1